jgi:hypothetical protein
MREEEDNRLMEEVRALSLQEVGPAAAEVSSRRRRNEERLAAPASQSSRTSRGSESRERRRRAEANDESDRRRGRNEPTTSSSNRPEPRRRRSQDNSRGRHEQPLSTPTRTVEHQASLRSLISNSDVDSREMVEEILRQIQEEGLLDGLDLESLDSNQDEVSQRIAEACRRWHSELSTARPSRSADGDSPTRAARSEQREASGVTSLRVSPRRRTGSRTVSTSNPTESQSVDTRPPNSSLRVVQPADETRRRRRTDSASRTRRSTSPVPAVHTQNARPHARSQPDLSDRPRSSEAPPSRPQVSLQSRCVTEPAVPPAAEPSRQALSSELPRSHAPRAAETSFATASMGRTQTPPRQAPPSPTFVPASAPSATTYSAQQGPLSPIAASHNSGPSSATERANALQSTGRPTSSSSATARLSLQRYHEPSITCDRCNKPHLEYDLHYNCVECKGGNYNICLDCFRAGRGCLQWLGFGNAAWTRWESMRSAGDYSVDRPHMLFPSRYIPPRSSPGGADGRRTITTDDPEKRLQSGVFCANCFAWANECYWRCDICNEGDWGFCNNCVNRGKCCTHALLPLVFKPDPDSAPPISPTHAQETPASASVLTGPDVIEYGRFKPLTFRVQCDVCHRLIQPSSTRWHCFSCTSSQPGSQVGDYDICTNCYISLERKKKISAENGVNGWRRCLKGHRMIIAGFQDVGGGQRRVIAEDLVGGLGLIQEPHIVSGEKNPNFEKWSWAEGSQVRLATTNVAMTAPYTATGLTLTENFPPIGGSGLRTLAKWSWYPTGGVADELLFPKGAEVRECVNINGDWFFGVYMGAKGLFPAPYVTPVGGPRPGGPVTGMI